MGSGGGVITEHKATLNGIEVHFTRAGEGPPVVLVHGLAQDCRSWSSVQHGLPTASTYAYDLRGHGRTTLGDSNGTLAQLRDDFLAFLEGVTGPAIGVGFSLGGTVVLSAAVARPDLVRRVVVMGTSSVVGRAAKAFYAERIELFRGSDMAAKAAALRADTAAALHNPDVDVDEVTRARVEAVGDGAGYVNAATAMASLADEPLTPELASITSQTPVTVIGAEHDTFCPRKAADIILDSIKHAEYREVAEAGHLMLIDQPARTVDVLRQCVEK
jgi:3-oxoadipate enol-lactonase